MKKYKKIGAGPFPLFFPYFSFIFPSFFPYFPAPVFRRHGRAGGSAKVPRGGAYFFHFSPIFRRPFPWAVPEAREAREARGPSPRPVRPVRLPPRPLRPVGRLRDP